MKGKVLIIAMACTLLFVFLNKYRILRKDRLFQTETIAGHIFKDSPEQGKSSQPSFTFKNFSIKPLATFFIHARVLSRHDYSQDLEARLSPIDLALGWRKMADEVVSNKLNITQGNRWYRYNWSGQPPIPPQEIIESSGNMHMIPKDGTVLEDLKRISRGDFIKLKGLLVEVEDNTGWRWVSSLARDDTGGGACELIFVEEVQVE